MGFKDIACGVVEAHGEWPRPEREAMIRSVARGTG
jgi:hypothetical protein